MGYKDEEKRTVLKRLIWREYEKYCMYLKREDLMRVGGWLGVLIPDGLNREAIFDHLYQSVGFKEFIEALSREADERITEREKLIAQLGGGAEAFKNDITKLQAFLLAVRNLAH